MLDQDKSLYPMNLSVLMTSLLDSAWIFLGEVTF